MAAFSGIEGGEEVLRLYYNGHKANTTSVPEVVEKTDFLKSNLIADKAYEWDVAVESFSLPTIATSSIEQDLFGSNMIYRFLLTATGGDPTPYSNAKKLLYASIQNNTIATVLESVGFVNNPVLASQTSADGKVTYVLTQGGVYQVTGDGYNSPLLLWPASTRVAANFAVADLYCDLRNKVGFVLAKGTSPSTISEGRLYCLSLNDGTDLFTSPYVFPDTSYPIKISGDQFVASPSQEFNYGRLAVAYRNTASPAQSRRALTWFQYSVRYNPHRVSLNDGATMRQSDFSVEATPSYLYGVGYDSSNNQYYITIVTNTVSGGSSIALCRLVYNSIQPIEESTSVYTTAVGSLNIASPVMAPYSSGSLLLLTTGSATISDNKIMAFQTSNAGQTVQFLSEQTFDPTQFLLQESTLAFMYHAPPPAPGPTPVVNSKYTVKRIAVTSNTIATTSTLENNSVLPVLADLYPDTDGISVSNLTRIVYQPFVRRYTSIKLTGLLKDINVAFWYALDDGILRPYPLLNGQAAFYKLCFRKRIANNPF